MKGLVLITTAFGLATAWPFAMESVRENMMNAPLEHREAEPEPEPAYFDIPDIEGPLEKRQLGVPSTAAARAVSRARTNCGNFKCGVFNKQEQFISTSGQYAYIAPRAPQIRGPCPGLNAAANHGYLDRSGVVTIPGTIAGLAQLYGMQADLSGFLAAYAVIFNGDPVLGTWSIGGAPPSSVANIVTGRAQGISNSHNNYEGDASIGRKDAFLNNGDAHSLDVARFKNAYEFTSKRVSGATQDNRYTLDSGAQNYRFKMYQSIYENPYAFWAPFAGLVAPAAYNFVINFMSNHSAAEPEGYFDGAQFKTFFAVTGNYPNFRWLPGQERIPNNWYRRTSLNQYDAANVFDDLGVQFAAYPDSFRLGGNTGRKNSYVGVDLGSFTGGVFTAQNLLQGNNLQCFFAQFAQSAIPDIASKPLQVANLVRQYFLPITPPDCPAVAKYDQTLFNRFPGYTTNPRAQPGTTFKE